MTTKIAADKIVRILSQGSFSWHCDIKFSLRTKLSLQRKTHAHNVLLEGVLRLSYVSHSPSFHRDGLKAAIREGCNQRQLAITKAHMDGRKYRVAHQDSTHRLINLAEQ